jgi:hypothetical protein
VIGRWVTAAAAVAILAAACSGDDGSASEPLPASNDATTTATAPPPTAAPASTTTTAPARGSVVAHPLVDGPVTGGDRGLPANPAPPEILDEYGYVEEEFFISGDATSYASTNPLAEDGRWTLTPSTMSAYTTRLLVRRPADAADSNGVVGVEWLNVSAGQDSDPDFGFLYPEMLSQGSTWVGVSAQFAGVDGPGLGIPIEGITATPLKTADPARYTPIEHPGDEYSYDIYSQAAQAIRSDATVMGGIPVHTVIAVGESQSAGRMVSYINGVHPVADIYDGFLVHSWFGGATSMGADVALPARTAIRTDLTDPILLFQTETDMLRAVTARQDDTTALVTWEVAGTAHADQSQLDYGEASGNVLDPDRVLPDFEGLCGGTVNQGPQALVLQRAWSDLVIWVASGQAPATSPLLEFLDSRTVRDDLGIAVGGIRTPDVDVPVAIHVGDPRPGSSIICSLFGSTTLLPGDVLADLYGDSDTYVAQVQASADAALAAGHLLASGVDQFVAEAELVVIPG